MIRPFFVKLLGDKRGAALVEYGLLIAGVALISAAGVSIFGAKTSNLVGAIASVLPGAYSTDNAPIVSGQLIETTNAATGAISLDAKQIIANKGKDRLGDNLLGTQNTGNFALTNLVIQAASSN